MDTYKYSDIIFETKGKVGIIKFNRPATLNSFGGRLLIDIMHALRVLDKHPETVFTVITGSGRFFSSGADVNTLNDNFASMKSSSGPELIISDAEKKLSIISKNNINTQLVSSLIRHSKVIVVAMNGPAVGGGAAWFQGVADIVLASTTTWLQCPFSALGLVPEFGSAGSFPQSIGVHRANDILMFGRKVNAEELLQWGMVNRVFEHEKFQDKVIEYLEEQLALNDGDSMLLAKALMNRPLIESRLLSLHESADAVAERFVEDAPNQRFAEKQRLLRGECSYCHGELLLSDLENSKKRSKI